METHETIGWRRLRCIVIAIADLCCASIEILVRDASNLTVEDIGQIWGSDANMLGSKKDQRTRIIRCWVA